MDPDRSVKKKRALRLSDVWRESQALLMAHRRTMSVGLALMVINRLSGLVLPSTSKFLIDNVIGESRADLLVPLASAVIVATLIQATTSFGLSQVVSIAGQRAIADMRRRVQAHVMRLPVSYFDSTKTGVLISRIMTDATGVRNLVGTGIIQLVGGLLTAFIAMGVLFFLNWRLTSLTIVLLATFGGSMAFAFSKLRPLFRERGKINAEVTGRLGEGLGGIRVLKTYVAERREERVFTHGAFRLLRNVATTITGTSALSAISTLIVGGVSVLIMVVGGRAILGGEMTVGDLVLYMLFVGMMVSPLVQMANIGTQISEAFAGLDRIREVMEVLEEDDDGVERTTLEDVKGEVVFDDVSFEYDDGVPVLKGVSLHAPPGTTTALVGPSGAGKSTVIGLVMAFSHPNQGQVRIDGHDLRTVNVSDYRRLLGVVLQETFLFDGTVQENIAFSRPRASLDDIREAARVANADEFIERFEDGYDTIVGERGVKLSGGQRQRIAIARAILADPRILILDEATSSLDSESEALIRDGIESLRRGRTTFVIAHRLSTIRSADQILVMDEGEVVEQGSHADLIAHDGLYRRLYDKQYGLEADTFVNPGEELAPLTD